MPVLTTWYYYNDHDNVTRVVTEQADNPGVFTAHRLVYARNDQAVTYALGETWAQNPSGGCPINYEVTYAYHFRYDDPRERYLVQELDPAGLLEDPPVYTVLSETWTDYDEGMAYGDFSIGPGGAITEHTMYEAGLGEFDRSASTGEYSLHNLIGTRRGTIDTTQTAGPLRVLTAFGEHIAGPSNRFGYAGAWGYQTDTTGAFPFLHLGARYYDPSTGRFLQRDPVGVSGGPNVYAYVLNIPTRYVDPLGEGLLDSDNWFHNWVADNFWRSRIVQSIPYHDDESLANMSNTRVVVESVGVSVVGGFAIYYGSIYGARYLPVRYTRSC